MRHNSASFFICVGVFVLMCQLSVISYSGLRGAAFIVNHYEI